MTNPTNPEEGEGCLKSCKGETFKINQPLTNPQEVIKGAESAIDKSNFEFIPGPCKKEGCEKPQWNNVDSDLCPDHTRAHYYPDKYDEDGNKRQVVEVSTDEIIKGVDNGFRFGQRLPPEYFKLIKDRLQSQQEKIVQALEVLKCVDGKSSKHGRELLYNAINNVIEGLEK